MEAPEEPAQDKRLGRRPFEPRRPEVRQDRHVQAVRHTIGKGGNEKKSYNFHFSKSFFNFVEKR